MIVGVLAMQGSFAEHLQALNQLGLKTKLIKNSIDLKDISGLIIPGGESTTISKLLQISGLETNIKNLAKKGMPIYGTCAGAILLANKISGKVIPKSLKLIDIDIMRNAYGSQLDSFEEEITITLNKKKLNVPAVFIRAPLIKSTGQKVRILGKNKAHEIVLAQEKNILVSTFHPELTDNLAIHQYFVKMCQKYWGKIRNN
jgi:5'-phosphate synthase pdxT subunit